MLARRLYRTLPIVTVALIGLCYVLISSAMPLLGDDLDIYRVFAWTSGENFYQFPRQCARFWMSTNGRFANFLFPAFMMYLPAAVRWICNGAFTALLFWMVIRCAGLRAVPGRMLMIALLAFTLPWWDMFALLCVSIGYGWGSAIGLAFLYTLFNMRAVPASPWARAGLLLLAFVAGGMHEALLFSIACGIAAWMIVHRGWSELEPFRRHMLIAFCLGGLIVASSPGIWWRLLYGSAVADGPWWQLLLSSSFYALALLAVFIGLAIAAPRRLASLCRGPWLVYAVAALASLPVVATGGIVGRPGIFGQVFALVALAMWAWTAVAMPSGRPGVVLALALFAIVAFHYAEFARYQWRVGKESDRALELYARSATGTVYMDYTADTDMPWWLLRKTRGVPDEDDFYINYIYTCHLGDTAKVWRVLPAALAELPDSALRDGMPVGRGRIVLHPGGEEARMGFGARLVTAPGRPDSVAVPIPGTPAYYLAPRDFDPSGSW